MWNAVVIARLRKLWMPERFLEWYCDPRNIAEWHLLTSVGCKTGQHVVCCFLISIAISHLCPEMQENSELRKVIFDTNIYNYFHITSCRER